MTETKEKITDEKNTPEEIPKFEFVSKEITTSPGCYLFFDANNKLLYVGKAKNLRKRTSQYFQKNKKSIKTELMTSKIQKIETRVTHSETESLILENNLIKEFQPRFNILMRDDKNFIYLRLTNQEFPRMEIVRRIVKDGAFYIGPKTSSKSFRKTIDFCQKIFGIRTCKLQMETGNDTKVIVTKNPENRKLPCLDFHVKKCSGPCTGEISPLDYRQNATDMKKFLRGNTTSVIQALKNRMQGFVEQKNFEAAAKTRDLILSVETNNEKQVVQLQNLDEADFVHFHRETNTVYWVRLIFRQGRYIDQNEVTFSAPKNAENTDILERSILDFYTKTQDIPPVIYLPEEIENTEEIIKIITKDQECTKPKFVTPQKGDKHKLLELALKNAQNFSKKHQLQKMSQSENFSKSLPILAETLKLESVKRIEAFDISHFSGTSTVASNVVFVDGRPAKSEYRRYKIKTLEKNKIDDFESMREVLGRRFTAFEAHPEKIPNLILIDGGKGQLSAVMQIANQFTFENFDPQTQIISLAKREEQIFRPGSSEPIELDFTSPALKLLQQLRDESHRFAITYNRSDRGEKAHKSILDEIDGIGPTTKKKLLNTFESIRDIKNASDEDLRKVLSQKQLENLRKQL